MLIACLASLAIVVQNQSALRAAPRDSAPQQAVLWPGDTLEIRGRRLDYLQVYDHRRERAGYVLASQAREISLEPSDAPDLLAVVHFLRDTPGSEALGIAYAAAYLRAAPAQTLTAEPFDAIGAMADRLARRASTPQQTKWSETTLAAHLESVAQYGIVMKNFERNGAVQVCYDGEMFRRVLAMPQSDPAQLARAALGVTREECIDPALGLTQRYQWDLWRADILDRPGFADLPEQTRNSLRLRRSTVWSALAFAKARRGEASQAPAERALRELTAVNKQELSDADLVQFNETAVRVAASRWAIEPAARRPGKLTVSLTPGAPGETCVLLQDISHDAKNPLVKRCTFSQVWTASAASNPAGTALTLAVQPLATWRELWLFHQTPDGWKVDVLPPGTSSIDLGYIEFAGWVPGGERLLIAREIKMDAGLKRRFEILHLDTLAVIKQSSTPGLLRDFQRWQDVMWKHQTLAMR